jgi:hypothetical protein
MMHKINAFVEEFVAAWELLSGVLLRQMLIICFSNILKKQRGASPPRWHIGPFQGLW